MEGKDKSVSSSVDSYKSCWKRGIDWLRGAFEMVVYHRIALSMGGEWYRVWNNMERGSEN